MEIQVCKGSNPFKNQVAMVAMDPRHGWYFVLNHHGMIKVDMSEGHPDFFSQPL